MVSLIASTASGGTRVAFRSTPLSRSWGQAHVWNPHLCCALALALSCLMRRLAAVYSLSASQSLQSGGDHQGI